MNGAATEDSSDDVLLAYGHVMAVVQQWELALAVIWLAVGRKHPNRPSGDFDSARSQAEILRLEQALLRKTAGQVRDHVGPHLEAETAAGLADLIDERNRLAHRYLREKAFGHPAGFAPGTRAEMLTLGARFMASLDSLARTIDTIPIDYQGPVPAGWKARAERLTNRVFTGQVIPKDPRLQ